MSNVIKLNEFRHAQEPVSEPPLTAEDLPPMIAYRDINGIPQIIVEGIYITQQQLDDMPDDVRAMLITYQ
ncbi:MAG: hypothetical protein GY800_06725 [Planctomycetes bacterium]|nr:hypothetical protein [Planctomycetota bacterium]